MNAKGIDVSRFNGPITNLLKQVDFVIAKASEGTAADPKYATFAAQTLQAGKVLGAYHFGVPGPNPTAQAQTLLSVARNAQFLALDVEGKALQSPAAMRAIIASLHKLDTQKRLVGLYASDGNWPGDLGQGFDWVAHWGRKPGRPWRFWQKQGSPLDLDEYNGTVAQLQAWAKTRRSASATAGNPIEPPGIPAQLGGLDMGWQEDQTAAIERQKARHARIGTEPVPAAETGPLAGYTRGQTLDYIAQLRDSLAADAYLPNATGPGLTVLPGTERKPLDDQARKEYAALVTKLTAAGNYTADELAEADAALAENLAAGVSLDPATAENV